MPPSNENAVATTDSPAVWVWDPERARIAWANEPGLRFWGERTLVDLMERDFAPGDEAALDFGQLLQAVHARQGRGVRARMVLAPRGAPVRVEARASAVSLPDGRPGLRVEAVRAPAGDAAEVDRLREIIERSPAAISLFAEDGTLLFQNAAADRSFDDGATSLAERVGDARAARDALRAMLVNGSHVQSVRLKTRTGERMHRIALRRMHDPVSDRLAAAAFFTDVEDRSRAAAAPGALASDAPEVPRNGLILDDALKPLAAGEGARALLGGKDDAPLPALGRLFPAQRRKLGEALTVLRDRRTERAEVALPGAEGRVLRLALRRASWHGAAAWAGTLTEGSAVPADGQTAALDALGVGVAELRKDGVIEAVSEAGAKLLGETPTALVGRSFDTALEDTGVRAFRAALARPGASEALVLDRPGATPLRAVLAPLEGERRGLAFSAEQANAGRTLGTARSEAIARASHELRTPLNAIIGFTQIMLDDPGAVRSDAYRTYLQDIHDSGQYMARLVQDMLDMRRIEAQALSLDPAPVDLGNLLRRIARDVDNAAKARDVTLTVSVDEDLPAVMADAHTMRQALTNLIGNAVKFTASPGWVKVSASLLGSGAVRVEVSDNGEGMSADELARALQPYAQGARNAQRFGGAGMGLPLAKGFVEANGARFEMASEKRVGTSIRVVFPPILVGAQAAQG